MARCDLIMAVTRSLDTTACERQLTGRPEHGLPYGTRIQKSVTSSRLFVERSPITGQIEVVTCTHNRQAQSAQCLVTTDKCLTHKAKMGQTHKSVVSFLELGYASGQEQGKVADDINE